MLYFLYTIIYTLALSVLLPFEYLKRQSHIRKRWLVERAGFFGNHPVMDKKHCLWIHAVSVGEVISSVSFVQKFRAQYPDSDIIVSTVTDTGQKVAAERLSDIAQIIYMPFDIPFFIRKTIDFFNPSLFIIMETELWPNIIKELKKRGIPVILINGRISEKSFNGYLKLRFFMKHVLQNIDRFCVQNEIYAERIIKLGAIPDNVRVTGNFKFDTRPPAGLPDWAKLLNGRVIIAGSTHEPEEEIILDAYMKLKKDFPDIILILAPRHPERFKEVEDLVKSKGVTYARRSDLHTTIHPVIESGVVILDAIGELAAVYGACDIAVIGGSFIKHGGQNPLEPAYWSKSIICGASMENFPFIEEFYSENAALKTDRYGLYSCLKELLQSPDRISAMGEKARKLYEKNSGATDRALDDIKEFLNCDYASEK